MLNFLIILHTLMKYKSQTEVTLDIKNKAKDAKALFKKFDIEYLPVLNSGIYKGLLFHEDIQDIQDDKSLVEFESFLRLIFLTDEYSIFDWFKITSNYEIDSLPIVNQNDLTYLNSIGYKDFIEKFKNTGLNVDLTSILVIKKSTPDFKYSEVFQIAEAHGAKIFGSYINSSDNMDTEIVINIHHLGLNELLQSYRRYGFDVISFHEEDLHQKTLQANSDYFSKYLTV